MTALGWEEGLKRRGPLPEVIDSFYNDMDECNCPEKNCECRMKYPPHIWENKKVKMQMVYLKKKKYAINVVSVITNKKRRNVAQNLPLGIPIGIDFLLTWKEENKFFIYIYIYCYNVISIV